jgi:hypothetical protein
MLGAKIRCYKSDVLTLFRLGGIEEPGKTAHLPGNLGSVDFVVRPERLELPTF